MRKRNNKPNGTNVWHGCREKIKNVTRCDLSDNSQRHGNGTVDFNRQQPGCDPLSMDRQQSNVS